MRLPHYGIHYFLLTFTEKEVQATKLVSSNGQVCLLCEQYASEALAFLSNDQTQREITDFLLNACSKFPVYKQQVFNASAPNCPLKLLLLSGNKSTIYLIAHITTREENVVFICYP